MKSPLSVKRRTKSRDCELVHLYKVLNYPTLYIRVLHSMVRREYTLQNSDEVAYNIMIIIKLAYNYVSL